MQTERECYGILYLFGRVGRLGEDGLPIRPHKHDERDVEEDQVDNWRRGRENGSAGE